MKILVVDDSLMIRNKMKAMLEKLGHSVILASNGKEGVNKYKEEKPDIITMDLNMPIMDGMATLKVLMRIDPSIKVIICTANGFSDSVLLTMREGASGYMLKPIVIDVLEDAIKKVTDSITQEEDELLKGI